MACRVLFAVATAAAAQQPGTDPAVGAAQPPGAKEAEELARARETAEDFLRALTGGRMIEAQLLLNADLRKAYPLRPNGPIKRLVGAQPVVTWDYPEKE
jgi:hypothetical protein